MQPRSQQEAIDAAKNIADLISLNTPEHDHAVFQIALDVISFVRGRELDRIQRRQEESWIHKDPGTSGGWAIPVLLLCVVAWAVIASCLAWYWTGCLLACSVAGLSYLAMRQFDEEDSKQGASVGGAGCQNEPKPME